MKETVVLGRKIGSKFRQSSPFMKIAGKKALGVALIVIGVVAFFTPFTPGSWLVFIGLEFLGIRLAFWQRIKTYFKK